MIRGRARAPVTFQRKKKLIFLLQFFAGIAIPAAALAVAIVVTVVVVCAIFFGFDFSNRALRTEDEWMKTDLRSTQYQ